MRHIRHALIALAVVCMTGLLQGATHSTTRIPHTDQTRPDATIEQPVITIPTPLFTREHMSRDASPQWLAMLNNPTEENARAEALARLYRKLHITIANHMVQQEEARMIARAKQTLGLEKPTNLQLLTAIATIHGLPIPGASND